MMSLLLAFQFLTRIPIFLKKPATDKQIALTVLYYPLVGLCIGVLLYAINLFLIGSGDLLRAAIVLFVWVLITGALHLDGLADSADALMGGFGDKERALAIMKDPYCGPIGVVALVLILLLKFSAIVSMSEGFSWLLLLGPCLSRTSVLLSFMTTPYVRENGLGSVIAKNFPKKNGVVLLLIISLSVMYVHAWVGFILLLSILVTVYALKHIIMRRFGGITGDTLGAQIEILETVVIIVGLWLM